MTWYKKIIISQMPPVWINKWTTYLRKNFEILLEHNYNKYEPYLIGSPEFSNVYSGLIVNIGVGREIYKVVFRREGDNLVSIIIFTLILIGAMLEIKTIYEAANQCLNIEPTIIWNN